MIVEIQVFAPGGAERTINICNPYPYESALGIKFATPVGFLPGINGDLFFSVSREGGIQEMRFSIDQAFDACPVQAGDKVVLSVTPDGGVLKSFVMYISSVLPSSSSNCDVVDVSCYGYANKLGNSVAYTIDPNDAARYNVLTLKQILDEIMVLGVANTPITYVSGNSSCSNAVFKIAFDHVGLRESISQVALLSDFELLQSEIESGIGYAYEVDAALAFRMFKTSGIVNNIYTLPQHPLRVLKDPNIDSFTPIMESVDSVVNKWYVKTRFWEGYLQSSKSVTIGGVVTTYSADSISKYGVREERLTNDFLESEVDAQKWIDSFAYYVCYPAKRYDLSLKQISDFIDVFGSVEIRYYDSVGVLQTFGAMPVRTIEYTISPVNDLSARLMLGSDAGGLFKRLRDMYGAIFQGKTYDAEPPTLSLKTEKPDAEPNEKIEKAAIGLPIKLRTSPKDQSGIGSAGFKFRKVTTPESSWTVVSSIGGAVVRQDQTDIDGNPVESYVYTLAVQGGWTHGDVIEIAAWARDSKGNLGETEPEKYLLEGGLPQISVSTSAVSTEEEKISYPEVSGPYDLVVSVTDESFVTVTIDGVPVSVDGNKKLLDGITDNPNYGKFVRRYSSPPSAGVLRTHVVSVIDYLGNTKMENYVLRGAVNVNTSTNTQNTSTAKDAAILVQTNQKAADDLAINNTVLTHAVCNWWEGRCTRPGGGWNGTTEFPGPQCMEGHAYDVRAYNIEGGYWGEGAEWWYHYLPVVPSRYIAGVICPNWITIVPKNNQRSE